MSGSTRVRTKLAYRDAPDYLNTVLFCIDPPVNGFMYLILDGLTTSDISERVSKNFALYQSNFGMPLERLESYLNVVTSNVVRGNSDLTHHREGKKKTNDDVEKALEVSDATATRYLDKLEKEGKIVQVGREGRFVKYLLK